MNDFSQSDEALQEGICHTHKECLEMYKNISQEIKKPVIEMLKNQLIPDMKEIKKLMLLKKEDWWIGYHFGWGMGIRNLLREKGFGEEYFGIHNLDDIYINLVEEAVNGS